MDRLAVLRGSDDLADAFVRTAESLGVVVVLDAATDDEVWLPALKAASPELVFFSGGAVEGAELIVKTQRAGVEATFMGGSGFDSPQLAQIGDEAVRGTLYVTGAPTVEEVTNPEDFLTGYQGLAGRLPGPQAIVAYDATRVLLGALGRAIELRGTPARDAVIAELSAIEDYPGLISPVTFDSEGDLVEPERYVYRVEL